jgi:cell division protein FtsQ
MKKKIFKILRWSLLLAYLIAILSFAARKKDRLVCSELVITVDNSHKFINHETVEKLLKTKGINTDSCVIDNLNFDEVEKIVESDPFVKNAEVYSDFKGLVHIDIEQRNPVMRIITKSNDNLYIDDECKVMPVCNYYSASVIVVTGEIDDNFVNPGYMPRVQSDTISGDVSLRKLFDFVNFINKHELWKAQFQQIYVTSKMEAELVPRVGNHIIILGPLENYRYKLGKLEALYKKGFAITDWNIYSSINLKYSDQVICKKR